MLSLRSGVFCLACAARFSLRHLTAARAQLRLVPCAAGDSVLLTEQLKPRSKLPPLLANLSERRPERLHYLGVSYGLTQQLYGFWSRAGFLPVYLRQSASETTGENTVVMLHALASEEVQGTQWLEPFVSDFRCRFMSLLAGAFRDMPPALALTILDPKARPHLSKCLTRCFNGWYVQHLRVLLYGVCVIAVRYWSMPWVQHIAAVLSNTQLCQRLLSSAYNRNLPRLSADDTR